MDNEKRKNNVKGNRRERANKGGRPVKGATEKLKYRVTVKMATEDYYLLKSKAKSAGVSASEFIRGCITEGSVKERLSKEHGELIRKLCDRDRQSCKPNTPMIAKIMKGSDFKGVVYYILNDEKGTQIIDADGLFLENNDTIAQGFIGQAQMNPRVTKVVGHIALSFSKEDAPRLNNVVMAQIAREYMERMGIKNTQYIIGRHFDKEHPHVHIAFNRIDNNGKTISDRNDRFRSERICKELTKMYGLHFANGKEQVKIDRLREPDKTRYELYQILKTEVGRCGNWNVLVNNLKRQDVEVNFKHKGQTDEIQGIIFTMNGYRFNGSKVDRLFSYSKIDAALRRNSYEERQEQSNQQQAYQKDASPVSDNGGNLIIGSLGLFSPNNMPEEQQPYDPYLRNKKKKKQRKINR